MRRIRIKLIVMVLFVVVTLIITGFSATETAQSNETTKKGTIHITIGTASVGGVFYPIGIAVAQIWNRCVPGVKAVAIATAGSPQNIDMLRTKQIEVAVLRSLEGYRAINGLGTYQEPTPWLRALTGPLYTSGDQIVALKDKGITSISDFRGKKIAVGPVGSGGVVDAQVILEAYGITFDDFSPEYIDASQAVDMMKDGLIDGAFLGLTIGASAISELMLTGRVVMLPIDDWAFEKMKPKRPGSFQKVIPAGTYPNQDYDVMTVADPPMILVCRADMSEDLVYQLVKSTYENAEELRSSAAIMSGFKLEDAAMELLVPYHSGSIKYFTEAGILH